MARTTAKIPNHKLFVQVTYGDLLNKLWLITYFDVNCEIYLAPGLADRLDIQALAKIRDALDKKRISRRAHAPIYDPNKDDVIMFKESYLEAFKLCRPLGIESVVMHAEYEPSRWPSIEAWLDDTRGVWEWIAEVAERDGLSVLLENHHESSARPIRAVLNSIKSDRLKACFDVGHFNAFGERDPTSFLGDYPPGSIAEIHLSDNRGDRDAHLALGRGDIDFMRFFAAVEAMNLDPAYTIEAKNIRGVLSGINYLKKIGKL